MKASRLPSRTPSSIKPISFAAARENFTSKFVPREPKEGEQMLLIQRPQVGPYDFLEYARGDLIAEYVCVGAKAGFTRRFEYGKRWEQLILVRAATDADRAAVADQRAAQDAETRRVMDRMMSS